MIREIGSGNSLFNQFLSELRSIEIQSDSMRFRRNLERVGEIFAYEISKEMDYIDKEVITPLGTSHMKILADKPVLATILRAGMPMHQGLLNYFDSANSAFVSAYRKYKKNEDFSIKMDYVSSPSIKDRVLILSDPMLATGGSASAAVAAVKKRGAKDIRFVGLVGAPEGVERMQKDHPDVDIYLAALDEKLNELGYIVPGLGDCGDRLFGTK